MAAPGHNNRENQEHEPGVWHDNSPTGIGLGEEFCKEFDHTDGVAWATLVFDAVTGKVPAKPRVGAYYPSAKDKPRFYECSSRAFAFVLRIAPFRSDIDNTDPNEHLFSTHHTFNPNRFAGTFLSAVDLVWFTEKDHSSKSNYEDWAGKIGKLDVPEFGIHPYINDIVPGYYVKTDSCDTKKYAVICPYRPLRSIDGEPEILLAELDKDEKFAENATPKSIRGEHIIEIGGSANSLCAKVVLWLKDNMCQYFNGTEIESGSSDGQVHPAHAMEKMLGILEFGKPKANFQTCNRKLTDVFANDKDSNLLGVRKGRVEWLKITKESTDLKKNPHETEKKQTAVFPASCLKQSRSSRPSANSSPRRILAMWITLPRRPSSSCSHNTRRPSLSTSTTR